MKLTYPEVDLPCESLAWDAVTEDILNIYRQSCQLQACIFALCTEGNVKATINLLNFEIKKNDLIVLLPGTIIQLQENTDKVRLCFAGFSATAVNRSNLINNLVDIYPKLIEQPVIRITNKAAGYIKDYFSLLARMTCDEKLEIGQEMVDAIFKTMLTVTRQIYKTHKWNVITSNRRKELCRLLIQEIIQHYKEERRAQYYADCLGVSLQHLSTTVKQVTGKNILDIIGYIVIMDAKTKLKISNMTIQEIAYSLNFPNATFFSKYFKRYVGMTPMEFRNK